MYHGMTRFLSGTVILVPLDDQIGTKYGWVASPEWVDPYRTGSDYYPLKILFQPIYVHLIWQVALR